MNPQNKSLEQAAKEYAPNEPYTCNINEAKFKSQEDFKAGANYQKQISDEREKLLMGVIDECKKTISCAEMYLSSCGHDKTESAEPEYQMLMDFKKTLASIEQTLRQINRGE